MENSPRPSILISFTIEEVIRMALEHHRAGRIDEAENLYRAILKTVPSHPDANHNMGTIAIQRGVVEDSLPFFKSAVEANPNFIQYWASYIDALISTGKIQDAKGVLSYAHGLGLKDAKFDELEKKLSNNKTGENVNYSKKYKDKLSKKKRDKITQLEDKALQAFNSKNYEESEKLSRLITQDYPDYAFGWKALGASLKQTGRTEESIPFMQKAVQLNPGDPETYNNLGAALNDLKRFSEAEETYKKAISIQPDFVIAYNNLGGVLNSLGRFDEAESVYKKAISIKDDYAEGYSNLGNFLRERDRLDEAENYCRKAVSVKEDYAEAYVKLGVVLAEKLLFEEAVESYKKALSLNPDLSDAYGNLGNALSALGKFAEAEEAYKKAISVRPDFAEVYSNIGAMYNDLGRFDEAAASYEKALSIMPSLAECHRNLSLIKRYKPDDPQIKMLQELYGTVKNDVDKIQICFALAKAYEDMNDIDAAFSFYSEGNALRKKELNYNIGMDKRLFDMIKSAFKGAMEMPPISVPLRSQKPILIVGMPRSGTSLVEQILASHSDVYGAGELEAINTLVKKYYFDKKPENIASASREIASGYLSEIESIAGKNGFVTDKMPTDFRWLGFIMLSLPDIKVVHVTRDRMAVCWSIFRQYFPAKGLGFTHDLSDLREYYDMYEDLMLFWKGLFPGRIYDLNYELLTENQEEETRKLLDYCGLEWEDACLSFEKTDRPVRTASSAQVREKIYKGSSEAWRRFEKHLAPLLKEDSREEPALVPTANNAVINV